MQTKISKFAGKEGWGVVAGALRTLPLPGGDHGPNFVYDCAITIVSKMISG